VDPDRPERVGQRRRSGHADAVLEAALTPFAERGCHGTAVSQIAVSQIAVSPRIRTPW